MALGLNLARLFLLVLIAPECLGKAYYEIKYNKYYNKYGQDAGKDHCDSAFGGRTSHCDFKFQLKSCVIGQSGWYTINSDTYYDTVTVYFGTRIGSSGNPVYREFEKWTGRFDYSIDVWDIDHLTGDDYVDHIAGHIRTKADGVQRAHTLHGSIHEHQSDMSILLKVGCTRYYYGDECTKYCKPHDDDHNGHYTCTSNGDKQCRPNWRITEKDCKVPDLCSRGPCQNGGVCSHTSDSSYECRCPVDYRGDHCETRKWPCEMSNLCENGGKCVNDDYTNSHCSCPPQWTGEHCQNDRDECLDKVCKHNATCINEVGDYKCECSRGFTGRNCTVNINECANTTRAICLNGGRCIDKPGTYACLCPLGFNGTHCESDVDECEAIGEMKDLCMNNGTCNNFVGTFNCTCPPNFQGFHCKVDVNECAQTPSVCHNNGTCNNTYGDFVCSCPPEWTGPTCDEDVNECLLDTKYCQNGGECVNTDGGAYCRCPVTFTGDHCQTDVDECKLYSPCKNGGICDNQIGTKMGYSCHCAGTGYRGLNCTDDIDECAEKPDNATCIYFRFCVNLPGNYTCDCMFPYYGDKCQYCNSTADPYQCTGVKPSPWIEKRKKQEWIIPVVAITLLLLIIGGLVVLVYWRRKEVIQRLPASIKKRIHTKGSTRPVANMNMNGVQFNFGNPVYDNDEPAPSAENEYGSEFDNDAYVSTGHTMDLRDEDRSDVGGVSNTAYDPGDFMITFKSGISTNNYGVQPHAIHTPPAETSTDAEPAYDDYNRTQYASLAFSAGDRGSGGSMPVPPARALPATPSEEANKEPGVYEDQVYADSEPEEEEEPEDQYGYAELPGPYSTIERPRMDAEEERKLSDMFDDNFPPPPPLPPRGSGRETPDVVFDENEGESGFVMMEKQVDDSIV